MMKYHKTPKQIRDNTRPICTVIRNRTLVIEIPLSALKFGIENNPDCPSTVKNIKKMGAFFKKNILDFVNGYSEDGASDFDRLLDNIAVDAIESAEPWILLSEGEE